MLFGFSDGSSIFPYEGSASAEQIAELEAGAGAEAGRLTVRWEEIQPTEPPVGRAAALRLEQGRRAHRGAAQGRRGAAADAPGRAGMGPRARLFRRLPAGIRALCRLAVLRRRCRAPLRPRNRARDLERAEPEGLLAARGRPGPCGLRGVVRRGLDRSRAGRARAATPLRGPLLRGGGGNRGGQHGRQRVLDKLLRRGQDAAPDRSRDVRRRSARLPVAGRRYPGRPRRGRSGAGAYDSRGQSDLGDGVRRVDDGPRRDDRRLGVAGDADQTDSRGARRVRGAARRRRCIRLHAHRPAAAGRRGGWGGGLRRRQPRPRLRTEAGLLRACRAEWTTATGRLPNRTEHGADRFRLGDGEI